MGSLSSVSTFVESANTAARDAFGRVRVSSPATLFDSHFQYDLQPLQWESALTATGTATHLPNESSVRMRVAASGDKVVRQTRSYFRYRPGKSLFTAMTFVMGAANANVRFRVGYFDASNGIFLERNGTTVSLVRRTNTSGTPSDADSVSQASWNIDKMDGTGPSGYTLDLTKAQILIIDLQWLGVGRVRVGFDIDGVFYAIHQFTHANKITSVYMTTANLPIRYEIEATGATGGNVDFKQICSTVQSEGGYELETGKPFAVSNGITAIGVTTRRPILSIRPAGTFNSIVNRMQILIENCTLTTETNSGFFELVYGGTLTNASFSAVGGNSCMEKDVAASAISGGDVIMNGFCPNAAQARETISSNIMARYPLTLNIAGANPINLSLVVTSFTGTCNARGCINWREIT